MAVIFKAISAFIFLSLLAKGSWGCSMKDLAIRQTPTGEMVNGKSEWRVTITNECKNCTQMNVRLKCRGFKTAKAIKVTTLTKLGAQCVINYGRPIYSSVPITFTYAWDTSFNFTPFFSLVSCPSS